MTLRFAVAPGCTARRRRFVRSGSRPAAWLWQIGSLLMLGALALPCHGAQIVPLEGPWLAGCLTARQTTLLRERPGQALEQFSLRRVLDCVVARPDGSLLGFGACNAVQIGANGQEQHEWRLPEPVRSCLRVGGGVYLLLLGGRWEGVELRQARAALWEPEQNALSYSKQVLEAWNAFELAGEGPGQVSPQQVLVAVRKTAPFDAVFRRRPFLFGLWEGALDLVPLWKGTSVAHPHLAAKLAHLGFGPGPQLCALEQLQDGRRMLGAYDFSGRMQMVGATAPAAFGDKLEVLWGGSGASDMLVCSRLEKARWRVVAYGGGSVAGASVVYRLQPRLQTALWATAPLAWNVVRGGQGPGILRLSKTGEFAFLALRAL